MRIPQHMIRDACEAEAHFTLDELEAHAESLRRQRDRNEPPYAQEEPMSEKATLTAEEIDAYAVAFIRTWNAIAPDVLEANGTMTRDHVWEVTVDADHAHMQGHLSWKEMQDFYALSAQEKEQIKLSAFPDEKYCM